MQCLLMIIVKLVWRNQAVHAIDVELNSNSLLWSKLHENITTYDFSEYNNGDFLI